MGIITRWTVAARLAFLRFKQQLNRLLTNINGDNPHDGPEVSDTP